MSNEAFDETTWLALHQYDDRGLKVVSVLAVKEVFKDRQSRIDALEAERVRLSMFLIRLQLKFVECDYERCGVILEAAMKHMSALPGAAKSLERT